MFIAMNRFKVARGREDVFEDLWKKRESYLHLVPGFQEFHLLRGATSDDHTLFASHTVWAARGDFDNWCNSESFVKAHAQARAPEGTYLAHPEFEGFDVILTQTAQP